MMLPVRRVRAANDIAARLAALEAKSGGRHGVAVTDTAATVVTAHRGDERFPITSTFKFLAATAVLTRVDQGKEQLDRKIVFAEKDLVTYSPATKNFAGPNGMPLDAICEAAITLSDNTAGNLLLGAIGGPAGLTEFARSLGDPVTRLDRMETELNEAIPGDRRDTTSPLAMLQNMRKILLGDTLSGASKSRLQGWLIANKTGGKKLRAGLPQGWSVGDKTGGGEHGSNNDIAIITPPQRAPLLVTAYFTESAASLNERDAVLADVGRIIADAAG